MNLPDTIELKNIDPDDISDVLLKIEKSFGFKFGKTELKEVKTFGQLCDIITSKVRGGDNANDCTTQQGFYKLRDALAKTLRIDQNSISFNTHLHELFPRHYRRKQIALLEKELGFKTHILRPKDWITNSLFLILIASVVLLFVFWKAGIAGLVLSVAGLKTSGKLGKELDRQSVKELAAKISREHYFAVRRHPSTVNRNEVIKTVTDLFSEDLALDKSLLTREATFD